MKKGVLKTILLIVLLVLAVVLGQIIGMACAGIHFLSWLGAAADFGLSTTELNLSIIKITFGIRLGINAAQSILALAAVITVILIKVKE